MPVRRLVAPDGIAIEWSERVISLNGVKPQQVPDDAVYIGRRIAMGGWRLESSQWQNPHSVAQHGLERALLLYDADVRARSDDALREWLAPLRNCRLACWCHRRTARGAVSSNAHLCHGDILAREIRRLWPEDL